MVNLNKFFGFCTGENWVKSGQVDPQGQIWIGFILMIIGLTFFYSDFIFGIKGMTLRLEYRSHHLRHDGELG